MFCIQDFNQICDLQILSVCDLSYCLNSIFERATVFSFDWSCLRNPCLIQSHRSFPFRSMIQFEMIFVYVGKVSIEVYIYPDDSPACFCWFSFPCGINFTFCWKSNGMCIYISGVSSVAWTICLYLCHYYTVLIIIDL